MAKRVKNRSKFPAMITYIIAVLALVAGLILPLGTKALAEGGINFDNMPALQLTGAIAALLAPFGVAFELPFGTALTASYSYTLSMFGLTIDLGAILLLLYALLTVIALVLVIPVCVLKRTKDSPRKIAVVIETLVLTVLLIMAMLQLTKLGGDWNLSIFIPFGVTLIMLIVQSIVYFKSSGAIKTVIWVLSALSALVAVWNLWVIIPQLASPVNSLLVNMQGTRPFAHVAGLFSLDGSVYGVTLLSMLFTNASLLIPAGNPALAVVNIVALSLSLLVCINLFLDMFGLGKRTNKSMLVFNLLRYVLAFLLIAALFGSVFWLMGNFGLSLYIVTVITLAQLIIAICRLTRFKKKATAAKKVATRPVVKTTTAPAKNYAYANAAKAETAATAAPVLITPAAQKSVAQPVSVAYNGPTDSFIRKLTNEEKVEFSRVFIDHTSGKINGVPEYVVGGENTKFFSSIFVYLARVRDHVSDALMDKLYEEVNLVA